MTAKTLDSEIRKELKINVSVVLRNFLKLFLKLWALIAVLALIGGVFSFAFTAYTFKPVYRSEATFTVTTNSEESLSGASYGFFYDSGTAEQLGLTFPHILTSELFVDAIKKELGVEFVNGTISASVVPDSNWVTMSVTGPDPEDAQAILNAAIKVYPDVSRFVIGETKFNIVDPATVPKKPFNTPEYSKNVVLGCAAGAALGIMPILAVALLRHTVSSETEIQNVINVPHLATLPVFKRKKRKKENTDQPLIITHHSSPILAEKLEALRMRVEKEMAKEKNVLLITSTLPNEGKSLISLNLSYYLAKHGKKVLLIDGDLRKQNLWQSLTEKNNELASLTSGEIPESFSAIDPIGFKPCSVSFGDSSLKLDFIGGKTPEKNTSGLLSIKLGSIIASLKNNYDYVIVDSPPTSGFEDVILINDYCDALLYVVKYDYAYKSKITEALALLTNSKADIIGYVFNNVPYGEKGKYGYGKYGYGKYGYGKYGYGKYGYGYGYGYGKENGEKHDK